MLNSLLNKRGQGQGNNQGMKSGGGGGDVNDGFFGEGASSLNIPVIGPSALFPRVQKQTAADEAEIKAEVLTEELFAEKISIVRICIYLKEPEPGTESVNLDQVPLKYRKAVKKYFGDRK